MVIISDQKEIQTNSNQVYGSKATLAQVSKNYMFSEVLIVCLVVCVF